MVVFTCQHCNAALKKPAVEKHYNTACRRNPYLTCVDCLVDFRGDEYISHTSCVSEDQRYGDKNFVPKPVAVKQNNWIEVVQSVIQRNENPKFKHIFEKLSNYPNVPRKKPKFVNFLKNGLKIYNDALAGEIFDAFQHEFMKNNKNNKTDTDDSTAAKNAEPKENGLSENLNESVNGTEEEPKQISKKKKKKDKKRNNLSECSNASAIEDNHVNDESGSSKKDKKKKSKKQKVEDPEVPSEDVDNANLDALVCSNDEEKKKKKKKKSLSEDKENIKENQVEQETDVSNTEENDKSSNVKVDKLSKKELKKLKKKQKYEAELKEIENAPNIDESNVVNKEKEEEVPDKSKSKKQKKRKATVSESEADSLKKPKVEENHEEKNEIESTLEGEVEEPNPKNKFNWEEIIKELLRKSSDNEMSIKRLSKKVLSEYQAIKGERETFEQLMSKFNKKVNKIPGVRILKDKAKLLAEE